METYISTETELAERGITGMTLDDLLANGDVHCLLPGVYCSRKPTALDKCQAVTRWLPDAVMSHLTAAWLHGFAPEPSIIDAYVRKLPKEPTPAWLRLRVGDRGIYAGSSFGPDVDV